MNRYRTYARSSRGFTLIELLTVIAIIGLLSSIVLVNLNAARAKAALASGQQFSEHLFHAFAADALGAWTFDVTSGSPATGYTALDFTINGNDAQLTSPDLLVPGEKGTGLQISGINDYASVPANSSSIRGPLTKITLAAWVYPTQYVAGTYGPTVVSMTDGVGWALRLNDGYLYPDLRLSDGAVALQMGPRLPLDTWSHIAVTYDGANIVGYVNGFEVGRTVGGGTLIAPPTTCIFLGNEPSGCTPQGDEFWWRGKIDEVAVYSQAATMGMIQKMYASGLPSHSFSQK